MRFTRTRHRLLLLVVVALTAFAACGSSGGGSTAGQASGRPVSGGSLTFATDTEPINFDIHVSPQDVTALIQRNVFDSLVYQDSKGAFHPWLAESWETAPDLRSYTFHLRTGVRFSDGTAFDAEAVKLNFEHVVAKTTKSQFAASLLGPYTGTEVIDPTTVKVSFSQPFAPFLQAASTAYLGFYSPKALAENAGKLSAGGPVDVGTGPFLFSSYTKGQSVVLTRNPAYAWAPKGAGHSGPAYLDRLTIRFLRENSVRVGALNSGQIDVAGSLPPANVKAVEANRSLQVLRRDASGGNYNIYPNTTRGPLTDERVRKALQQGINIDQNVRTVYFGQYKRAWSPVGALTPSYNPALVGTWPYDAAKANRLLDEAGWTGRDAGGYRTKDGKRLSLRWPIVPSLVREQRDILGQAIQEDLHKIGVEIVRPSLDAGTYIDAIYSGDYDLLDLSWARFEPDVLRLAFHSKSTAANGGQNASYFNDPDVDRWTVTGEGTFDTSVRNDVYAKTQQRVIERAAVIPVYTPSYIVGAASYVRDLTFDTNAWPRFYDVWRDKK
ncbi:Peptide/nickel transport system substrate-binding protein [Frankia canadensis]|uniref:Peptide/nickel transport system substrate-binding protein n=1 Tax=Frankia canadensis TaxID=1836972 RepID=A0A2I2KKW6_9ACTN|nr:ABC transporter substrate-binding protein [Frankia canadensis]SNQ46321.1 Peptide/nickel transport system substrate-binding protein [Frankia canadensis]SOU53611.1 Peptide/nickel transport system substrate-binding protein [Frankia canadensis]